MVARSISLMNMVDEYNISDETILNIFYDVLNSQNISIYNDKLEQLFILSLIHISEPTRLHKVSRMPSSA